MDEILAGRNVVVNAVAGAGKTQTSLTTAIEHLKQMETIDPRTHQCRPPRVVVVTYNRRLKEEVRQKIQMHVPSLSQRILIHTYYSLCAACFNVSFDSSRDNDPEREESESELGQVLLVG